MEVKARNSSLFGEPYEAVGYKKQEMMRNAAEIFMEENSEKYSNFEVRFDIISIIFTKDKKPVIELIKDAFR